MMSFSHTIYTIYEHQLNGIAEYVSCSVCLFAQTTFGYIKHIAFLVISIVFVEVS